jgi:Heterokaryon incompatibility protein (HET)
MTNIMRKFGAFLARSKRGDAKRSNKQITAIRPGGSEWEPPVDHFCLMCLEIMNKSKLLDRIACKSHSKNDDIERWPHHSNVQILSDSVEQGCHLCSLLYVQCCPTTFEPPDELPLGQLTVRIEPESLIHGFKMGLEDVNGELNGNSLEPFQKWQSWDWQNDPGPWRTSSTSSQATIDLAKKWLNLCLSTHKECRRHGTLPDTKPNRLLILSGSSDDPSLHLAEVTSQNSHVPYLTLSHCWGNAPLLTTTRGNYHSYLRGILYADLPQTFKDAVTISLRLGYTAIWIDALCIIQDDKEDWESIAPNMGLIYGNSVCTIAALSSAGSAGGCYYERRPLSYLPCSINTKNGNTLKLSAARARGIRRVNNPDHKMGNFDAPPLHQRGWVVQERALSPRTLYFSNVGIYWECCYVSVTETEGERSTGGYFATGKLKLGVSRALRARQMRSSPSLISSSEVALDRHASPVSSASIVKQNDSASASEFDNTAEGPDDDVEERFPTRTTSEWYDQWWHLVQIYTKCNLTRPSDRWPAILGIAGIFSRASESQMIAGLWRSQLNNDLLWEAFGSIGPNLRLHSTSQPSWSWLSISRSVRLNGIALSLKEEDFVSRILAVRELDADGQATVGAGHDDEASLAHQRQQTPVPCLTVSAPMMKLAIVKLPTGSIDNFERLNNGTLHDALVQSLNEGKWSPDIFDEDLHLAKLQDIWALQCTREKSGVHGLIVKPMTHEQAKWCRLGQFHAMVFDGTRGSTIGEVKVINLY